MEKLVGWIDLAVPYCGGHAESSAWDSTSQPRHDRYVTKRRAMKEIGRTNIQAFLEDRQQADRN